MGISGMGAALTQAGENLSSTLNNTMNSIASFKNMGSSMANGVSQMAQNNQFAFNSAEAALQRDYNQAIWEATGAYNSAEAATNRAFQHEEAEANRNWQERMANTSYQRAVEDLKKAGLNPILAALNSGAPTGSGAMASGSQASVGTTSGAAASGSNYQGQGSNISEELAMFGAIGSMIGQGITALGAYLSEDNNKRENEIKDWVSDHTWRGYSGFHWNPVSGFFNSENSGHWNSHFNGNSSGGGHRF